MCSGKRNIEYPSMISFSRPDRQRTPLFARATHLGTLNPDLERDSGFSDASSEYLSTVDLTDSEDAGRSGSMVGQDTTGSQVAVMGGSYAGLSPMIIMNNFVLKQCSWSGSSSPPKTCSEYVQQSKSYMLLLKSYPRIAPHPVEVHTKRVGSSRVRGTSASAYDQRQRRHQHSHRLYSSPSPQSTQQTPAQPVSNFEAANNQPQAAESQEQLSDKSLSPLAGTSSLPTLTVEFRQQMDNSRIHGGYQDALSMDSNKLKRFSNTYNILSESGLLGITLRTKQLIKENKRTQGQLQQLQEQTALLLEALTSGDPQLWTKLQLSLQDTEKEQFGAKAQRVLA